jgi:hypothetical protein
MNKILRNLWLVFFLASIIILSGERALATEVTILKQGTGTGLVYNATSHEPGMMCGPVCNYDFMENSQVRFLVSGDPYTWSGDCNINGVVVNLGTTNKTCTITFTSTTMPDASITNPNWTLSSGASISGDVLTLNANSASIVKATLDIPVTSDMLNTDIYLIGDVQMDNITSPANYILAPSIAMSDISSGTAVNSKKHLFLDGSHTGWLSTGSVNKFNNTVTDVRITIMLQNITTGTFKIKNLRLTRTPPSYSNVFPFSVPPVVTGEIDINTNNTTTFNNELLGLSPYLGEYNTSPLNYDDQPVKNLVAEVAPPTLRFPGGAHSNWYDWETDNFIDPIPADVEMNQGFLTHWQDRLDNNKTWKFNDFAQVLNTNNMSAILTFNVLHDTPAKSVARLNDRLSKLNSLKYIEMGNENYFKNQRSGNLTSDDQNIAVQQYITHASDHINAMKAVDDSVMYGVNVHHDTSGAWDNGLAADQGFYDFIIPHLYINWPFNSAFLDFDDARRALTAYSKAEEMLEEYHNKFPTKPMVISEWGSIAHDTKKMGNALAALSAADIFFAIMDEPNVTAAQYYTFMSGYPMGTHRTLTPNNTMVRMPMAFTYKFLHDVLIGNQVFGSTNQSTEMITDEPFIRSIASIDNSSGIKVFVLNKAPSTAAFDIMLDGVVYTGDYNIKSYSESDIYARKIYQVDPTITSTGSGQIILPAYSINVIELNNTPTIRADVDQNSFVNTTDAFLTLRNSLGINMSNTNWQVSATTGDVNCDGNTNSTDAFLTLRSSLGLNMGGTDWCIN